MFTPQPAKTAKRSNESSGGSSPRTSPLLPGSNQSPTIKRYYGDMPFKIEQKKELEDWIDKKLEVLFDSKILIFLNRIF
jgi:hypothetical protein